MMKFGLSGAVRIDLVTAVSAFAASTHFYRSPTVESVVQVADDWMAQPLPQAR